MVDLVLIPKEPFSSDNPRAICLIDTIAKVFEKVLANRINTLLESDPERHALQLSDSQYGFRRIRSTNDALMMMYELVREATALGNLVLVVSLDIKNAFNSIPFSQIRKGLNRKKCPDYLKRIILSYLTDRSVCFRDRNGKLRKRMVMAGVPQGSVLGPLLWNIAFDGVVRTRFLDGNRILCFADDTLILLVARNTMKLNECIRTDLYRVLKMIKSYGLSVSVEKTDIMLFGGRNKDLPLVKMGRSSVQTERVMKYLGVMIDSRWSFIHHIKYATEKATRVSRALERLMPSLRGPSQSKRSLYLGIILSILLYAAPLWCQAVLKSQSKQKLFKDIVRRTCTRVVCAYRTTAADAVMLLAGLPPVHLLTESRENIFNRIKLARHRGDYSKRIMLTIRNEEKNILNGKWKRFLKFRTQYGRRTIQPILPYFEEWINREFGYLNYKTTQLLTGHGCFRTFLKRIGKKESAICFHCLEDVEDTPEHTIFNCFAWKESRDIMFETTGQLSSLSELIGNSEIVNILGRL